MKVIYDLDDSHILQLHELYQHEWWTNDRTLEDTRKCVAGLQLCIGLIDEDNRLTGFARVITDYVFKALILDVIVNKNYRRHGLGQNLIELIKSHDELKNIRHFELYCLPEMFTFYQKHGFTPELGDIKLMRLDNK